MEMVAAIMKNTMEVSTKRKTKNSDLAFPFHGTYPKQIKSEYLKHICTLMFPAVLLKKEPKKDVGN
jgi:hypothetical protein